MRTIIAGSRNISDLPLLAETIDASGFYITEVVSGGDPGVGTLGLLWARKRARVTMFLLDWAEYGSRANYVRNEEMADYADALIALWDGVSSGTKHMIETARKKGLKIYVRELSGGVIKE